MPKSIMVRGLGLCQWVAYQPPTHCTLPLTRVILRASRNPPPHPRTPSSHLQAPCSLLGTWLHPPICLSLSSTEGSPCSTPPMQVRGPLAPYPALQHASSMPYGGRGEPSSIRQKDTRPGPRWASSQAAPPPRRDGKAETSLCLSACV